MSLNHCDTQVNKMYTQFQFEFAKWTVLAKMAEIESSR